MENQKIQLSLNLVNALLQYLGTRPYVDVATLINAVHNEAEGQLPKQQAETPNS
jgi:hypothetical protein